jgi:hypothetical protein
MRIKISNERLWDITQSGEDIDQWLRDNIGYGGWREWFNPFTNVPYRCIEIDDEQMAVIFRLRWA